jgi:hypothetical protein
MKTKAKTEEAIYLTTLERNNQKYSLPSGKVEVLTPLQKANKSLTESPMQ